MNLLAGSKIVLQFLKKVLELFFEFQISQKYKHKSQAECISVLSIMGDKSLLVGKKGSFSMKEALKNIPPPSNIGTPERRKKADTTETTTTVSPSKVALPANASHGHQSKTW